MDNVLPSFKTFNLDKDNRKKQEKNRQWNPDNSLPRINNCISFLNGRDERNWPQPKPVTSYLIANSAPPNKRYLDEKHTQSDGDTFVSPLSSAERGEKMPSIMKHTSLAVTRKNPAKSQTVPQVLEIENGGGVGDVQIFFTGTTIRSTDLEDGQTELRYINGSKFKENSAFNQSKVMDFYISTTRRLASVMSLRQEIFVFEFKPGPLGIEVQLRNGKLCCASISPGSQADAFDNLKESEPLSINGTRVVTLGGFERALRDAQHCRDSDVIKIEALVLKEEKLPYEDMIGVNLKNKKMSNLFKNVLNKGKGPKRGGRFQNMSLGDSDDDEDEDEDDNALTVGGDKDENSSTGVSASLVDGDTQGIVEESGHDNEGHEYEGEEKGTWQFASKKDNEADFHSNADLLPEVNRGICDSASTKIVPNGDWKNEVVDDDHTDEDEDEDADDFCIDDDEEVSSVQNALMASPNRHRETGLILQSIALGVETVIPPVEEVVEEPVVEVVEEESLEEETEETSMGQDVGITGAGWDYATALDGGDLTAHLKLICVPGRICSSQNGWGEPSQQNFMNFVNISSKWDVEIFWVGEDSALISRSILEQNENHVELLSSEHVWCLTARRHDIEELDSALVTTDDDVEVQGMSSVSILFRPPKKSVENVIKRCVRVMWIPWVSLSFAETSTQLARGDTNEYPDVDFKIFDHHPSEEEKGKRK